jgi:hypothetical protein
MPQPSPKYVLRPVKHVPPNAQNIPMTIVKNVPRPVKFVQKPAKMFN